MHVTTWRIIGCLSSCFVLKWSVRPRQRPLSLSAIGTAYLLNIKRRRSTQMIHNLCIICVLLVWRITLTFLANVNSRSRSLYAIARPSVCLSVCLSSVVCLSVTFVRFTQAVQIFGNISTALGTLAIHWHSLKISPRSSQRNPSAGGFKHKRGSKI